MKMKVKMGKMKIEKIYNYFIFKYINYYKYIKLLILNIDIKINN